MRIIWQTVRRITNEILGVKGLIPSHHSHTGCKIQEHVPPCTKKGWAKINLWADCWFNTKEDHKDRETQISKWPVYYNYPCWEAL